MRRIASLALKPVAPELAIVLGVADGRLDCAWSFHRPDNPRVLPRRRRGASDVLTGQQAINGTSACDAVSQADILTSRV